MDRRSNARSGVLFCYVKQGGQVRCFPIHLDGYKIKKENYLGNITIERGQSETIKIHCL